MSTRKQCGKFKTSRLAGWVSLPWSCMSSSGKGYKRHSLKNSGKGADRRADKLDASGAAFTPAESKVQRAARLSRLGVRHG